MFSLAQTCGPDGMGPSARRAACEVLRALYGVSAQPSDFEPFAGEVPGGGGGSAGLKRAATERVRERRGLAGGLLLRSTVTECLRGACSLLRASVLSSAG